MNSSVYVTRSQKILDCLYALLGRADTYLWPQSNEIDASSHCFFICKPYPGNLSTKQKKDWAELQATALSPFASGDFYYFLTTTGLHLWVSQSELNGVPETALQVALDDGEYLVAGKHHLYHQVWGDGIMKECVILPDDTDSELPKTVIDTSAAWAVRGQLKERLTSGKFWIAIASCLFFVLLLWTLVGAVTVFTQNNFALSQINKLDPLVSDLLTQQTELANHNKTINLINSWQSENGYLPESLGIIADRINAFGKWQLKEIVWQEKQLSLQIDTRDIDIAALITDLESLSSVKSVGIKPYGNTGDFLLEVFFGE